MIAYARPTNVWVNAKHFISQKIIPLRMRQGQGSDLMLMSFVFVGMFSTAEVSR